MRLPPLNALKAFEAAARHLSFQKAAQELHVTASALSYQIKSLEEHLGVAVFVRGNRQVTLTREGEQIRPGIAAAFETMQQTIDQLKTREEDNIIVVSCGPSHAAKWLAPRLYRFADDHPDLELRVSATLALTDFYRDDVDVALRFGPGNYPGLHSEKMFDEFLTPMVAPHLLQHGPRLEHPDDLKNFTLLHDDSFKLIGRSVGWVDWLEAAGASGVNGEKGLRFTHADHVLEAAINGAGVVMGRVALGREDVMKGRLIAPFPLQINTGFATYFVCPPAHMARPKVQKFRNWLFKELGC
ncbi:MAG: transcriptional regulator GcvA [Cohaesibacter sp.]|jgi:LysR family glycine cleavage system transcriptional activator|nr:transcriptional regulator GcvA [Cohaesibacter sp.]